MAMMSMDDLCGGALRQKFNMEMMRIGQNIMNPNTSPKKPRKMTITLTFKPDESRQMLETAIEVRSTLAPLEPISTVMLAGQDMRTGMISMSEYGNRQQEIRAPGEMLPVEAEVIPPERREPEYISGKPIDLRQNK